MKDQNAVTNDILKEILEKTSMTLEEHYEFYLDNCTENEVPISFDMWQREYLECLLGRKL